MMEYKVVSSSLVEEFEIKVNELLAKGWKCQGGLFILSGTLPAVYQAMVRNIETGNNNSPMTINLPFKIDVENEHILPIRVKLG